MKLSKRNFIALFHAACVFNHESTKSKAIVTATTKREQRRGNAKREEIVSGKVWRCAKKELIKEIA